jgi:hypothetical protein
MEEEAVRKYMLVGGILLALVIGALSLVILIGEWDNTGGSDIRYDFRTRIDSRNNTVLMEEPNRTVNWNHYLVVVNGTYVMRRSQVAVPGITTTFYHDSFDPNFGCCYEVEVVGRERSERVWNGTVEAI